MAGLITLDQLKVALNIDPSDIDNVRDARLQQAITSASAAVSDFCDRSFGVADTVETRSYEYDDVSGFIDIDDCAIITAVVYSIGNFDTPIDALYWRAEPFRGPVFTYLRIPTWYPTQMDPAMGFNQNLDVISRDRGWPGGPPVVKVTATFGWPEVPDAVQQAVVWTSAEMAAKPEDYVAESIAGYSYTAALSRAGAQPTAVPSRAQDILQPYVRAITG